MATNQLNDLLNPKWTEASHGLAETPISRRAVWSTPRLPLPSLPLCRLVSYGTSTELHLFKQRTFSIRYKVSARRHKFASPTRHTTHDGGAWRWRGGGEQLKVLANKPLIPASCSRLLSLALSGRMHLRWGWQQTLVSDDVLRIRVQDTPGVMAKCLGAYSPHLPRASFTFVKLLSHRTSNLWPWRSRNQGSTMCIQVSHRLTPLAQG